VPATTDTSEVTRPGCAGVRWLTWAVMTTVPTEFATSQGGGRRIVPITVRSDSGSGVDELAKALASIAWSSLSHAYGPAGDVPGLLFAITLGTDDVRRAAWWEIWGNIHHQGTVYEATVPSVPFIHAIGRSVEAPDRVQALTFLRQIAIGDGPFAAAVRAAVRPRAESLVAGWRHEPEPIQRALLLLSTAYPEFLGQHPDLVRLVPDSMRDTWNEVVATSGFATDLDDDATDRQDGLEQWALAGLPRN
jgi:hypothetical protein